jgi:tight adherence protein B
MGAVLGLGVGVGLVLIASAFVVPRAPRPRSGPVLRPLLARAGLAEVRPAGLLAVSAVCALVGLVAVQVLSRTAPVALAFGCIGAYLPFGVLRGRARRRQREFAEVWPEAVDNLASGIRAGLALPEALSGLAVRGPEPLRESFAAFALDYQASGRFADSLDRLKERLADPVGDRVVEALRVAREVGGGDLGRLLRSLSSFLREDARTRAELESRQAWTVNGARLAVSAPWLVLLLLSFQREVIGRYATGAGVVVLLGGAATCAAAYWMMMRIGRLPTERRILR